MNRLRLHECRFAAGELNDNFTRCAQIYGDFSRKCIAGVLIWRAGKFADFNLVEVHTIICMNA